MDLVEVIEDYSFIGNEFLTWLWFKMDTDSTNNTEFYPGSKIVLSKEKESVMIKGEESDLIIGKVALTDGFVVTEMNVTLNEFNFTLKGADLAFNSLRGPKIEGDGSQNEEEGLILENIYLVQEVSQELDLLFMEFIQLRIENWPKTLTKIKYWVNDG